MYRFAFVLVFVSALASCGPKADAREVCDCFQEVYKSSSEDASAKMNECLSILEKNRKKHEGKSSAQDFQEELDKCK